MEIRHYEWEGAHRALADTLALRAVWKFLKDKNKNLNERDFD